MHPWARSNMVFGFQQLERLTLEQRLRLKLRWQQLCELARSNEITTAEREEYRHMRGVIARLNKLEQSK